MTDTDLSNIEYTPGATRDYLPEEWAELQDLVNKTQSVFESSGYLQLRTPIVEFRDVLAQGGLSEAVAGIDMRDGRDRAYTLRTDMTVQIARLVGSRYQADSGELKFRYEGPCFRDSVVRPGEIEEVLQSGVELIGVGGNEGAAECLGLICQALDAVGLENYKVGVGHAEIYRSLLEKIHSEPAVRAAIMFELETRDLVGLEREVNEHINDAQVAKTLIDTARAGGGPEILNGNSELVQAELDTLREIHGSLSQSAQDRMVYSLGLVRDRNYYTGEIFEIYAAATNEVIGRGGRYDNLLGKFGSANPAIGFVLDIEPLHVALATERGVS